MMQHIVLTLFLIFASMLQAKEPILKISTGFNYLEANFLKSVLLEASTRMGMKLQFETLPNQRSLINANSGLLDGEAARIAKISKIYPNLIKVNVTIHKIDIVVMSTKKLPLHTLTDLQNYTIGVVRGVKITEKIANKVTVHPITYATSYKSLLYMLKHHRLDLIIVNKMGALTGLQNFKDTTFYIWKKPIVSPKLYTQLNKKNIKLIPEFEKVYRSMQKDGSLQALQEEFNAGIKMNLLKTIKVIEYD